MPLLRDSNPDWYAFVKLLHKVPIDILKDMGISADLENNTVTLTYRNVVFTEQWAEYPSEKLLAQLTLLAG